MVELEALMPRSAAGAVLSPIRTADARRPAPPPPGSAAAGVLHRFRGPGWRRLLNTAAALILLALVSPALLAPAEPVSLPDIGKWRFSFTAGQYDRHLFFMGPEPMFARGVEFVSYRVGCETRTRLWPWVWRLSVELPDDSVCMLYLKLTILD